MRIREHYGHELVVAQYSDTEGHPVNFALECLECSEVLADEDVAE